MREDIEVVEGDEGEVKGNWLIKSVFNQKKNLYLQVGLKYFLKNDVVKFVQLINFFLMQSTELE